MAREGRKPWVLAVAVAAAACGRSGFLGGSSPAIPPVEGFPFNTPTPASTFTNPPAPPALVNWGYRRHILVSGATTTIPLDGFPLPLLFGSGLAAASSGGADLRFVDEGGNALPHQIELWSTTAAISPVVWVASPTIVPTTGASLWVYYGSPGAPDVQNPSAVFSTSFAAVYHLDPTLADSTVTANGINAVGTGTHDSAGLFGRGYYFDGTVNAILSAPNKAVLNFNQQITLSAWVNVVDFTAANRRAIQKGDNDNQFKLDNEAGSLAMNLAGVGQVTGTLPATNSWHYIASTYDHAQELVYLDGQQTGTPNAQNKNFGTTNNPLHIGAKQAGGNATDHMFGIIDEVRISPLARPPDWIATEYASGTGALVTIGPEEKR